jgi:hypothetical protein
MNTARALQPPVAPTPIARSLAALVRDEAAALEGGSKALAEQVRDANGGKMRFAVDRRKLARLAEEADVSLSLFALHALETYFQRHGKTLRTLFTQDSILNDAVRLGPVTFLLGAKRSPDGEAISRWDFLAATELIKQLKTRDARAEIEMLDVPRQMPIDPSNREVTARFTSEPWSRCLESDERQTVIAVGSPLSCHAAETMLAAMFDAKPFVPARGDETRPPFGFIWAPQVLEELPSAFSRPSRRGIRERRDVTGRPLSAYGLEFNGLEYTIEDRPHEWDSHAVVAVQRRRSGQLWIVLAGTSGPDTLAAAHVLDSFAARFAERVAGRHSAALWTVVESRIRIRLERTGDKRELNEQRFLFEPRPYPPV